MRVVCHWYPFHGWWWLDQLNTRVCLESSGSACVLFKLYVLPSFRYCQGILVKIRQDRPDSLILYPVDWVFDCLNAGCAIYFDSQNKLQGTNISSTKARFEYDFPFPQGCQLVSVPRNWNSFVARVVALCHVHHREVRFFWGVESVKSAEFGET